MHVIRLRSAWELLPPGATAQTEHSGHRFVRSFGLPTNLGEERVFLTIEPPPAGIAELNGEPLQTESNEAPPAPRQFRHDVTRLLKTRNQLVLTTNSPAFDHEVRLEIVE
jgi:hypothetical protein